MTKEEIQRISFITLFICILYLIFILFLGNNLLTISGVKSAFSVSILISAWWVFYFNWGWKIPGLKLILKKENLNGTWCGKYESRSIKNNNQKYNGDIFLVIKQNYLSLNIISIAKNTKSRSYSESLRIKNKNSNLVYVYAQIEDENLQESVRKGVSELEHIIINANGIKDIKAKEILDGKFYTNAGTIGNLKFERVTKKHFEDYETISEFIKNGGK